MSERARFLNELQIYLKRSKSTIALPSTYHDYVYHSYSRENVEFSVGCKGKGFTVRFLLRGSAKQHLDSVYDHLKERLAPVLEKSEAIEKTWIEGKDRATVVVDCSKSNISNPESWTASFERTRTFLDIFWRYFVINRKNFKSGKTPKP